MNAPRRRLKPDESRAAAIAAARDLLLEAGPQAVTLKAVADRIGRTHANVLHHFGSAASLQSELGQATLRAHGLPSDPALGSKATMVVIEGGRVYQRSTAALRVARLLRWPWPLLYAAVLVPRFLRDWAYDTFAARRYWFGQSDQCRIPTPELRRRFVT